MATVLDNVPPEVRAYVESLNNVLMLTMQSDEDITVVVGERARVKLSIKESGWTREVLDDVIAHLVYYKKYFPKDADSEPRLKTPEAIFKAFTATLLEYQEARLTPPLPPTAAYRDGD